MEIKLTQYSKGSGCGCKIAPSVLEEILNKLPIQNQFSNLMVGNELKDDAAVWKINDALALISTTDFFTPIVDDPYLFGKIAAANALSDVYAMGGKPILSLAILGWPIEKLSTEICAEVLKGAEEITTRAGIPIAGGHSIDISEPVFGLSVTGIIHPSCIKTNANAKVNDVLYLTKPIGSGILSAALKRNILNSCHYEILVKSLTELNCIGEILGAKTYVNSMTDVTGFGLIGHLNEICEASIVSAQIFYSKIPMLEGLENYINQFCFPDNTTRNLNAYKNTVEGMDALKFIPLCDPQTNGGLLISVNPEYINEFETLFKDNGFNYWQIGKIIPKQNKNIIIT
ncbi:MAG: selenide, water dikinase SelD [Bacteroidia bacterium]